MEQSSLNPKRIANTPRIYVASLADYNAGRLHGRWIDADQPIQVIREEIAAMLAESKEHFGAEERAIHDHENVGGLSLSKSDEGDLHELALGLGDDGHTSGGEIRSSICLQRPPEIP